MTAYIAIHRGPLHPKSTTQFEATLEGDDDLSSVADIDIGKRFRAHYILLPPLPARAIFRFI